MAEIKLSAESRSEFGKGAARRIRRADKVPAVLYGHGTDPVHITLPGHETLMALRQANVLLEIDIQGGKNVLALPKQVQRDPIKGFLEHIDLIIVKRGEKVQVEVPVVLSGEAAPETVVTQESTVLLIEAEATNIPAELEVSIEGLEVGAQVLAKDVTLPSGVTLAGDEEALVVNVTRQLSEEELAAATEAPEGEAAEETEGDEAAEGAEGEAAEGEEKPEGDAGEGEKKSDDAE